MVLLSLLQPLTGSSDNYRSHESSDSAYSKFEEATATNLEVVASKFDFPSFYFGFLDATRGALGATVALVARLLQAGPCHTVSHHKSRTKKCDCAQEAPAGKGY